MLFAFSEQKKVVKVIYLISGIDRVTKGHSVSLVTKEKLEGSDCSDEVTIVSDEEDSRSHHILACLQCSIEVSKGFWTTLDRRILAS